MKPHTQAAPTPDDMQIVREGILQKYETYHALNRDKYPTLELNSSRDNYEPLQRSFEEEFFDVRNISRSKNHLHIPSLSTFARLFSESEYIPNKRIYNTCLSYAEYRLPHSDNQQTVPIVAPTTLPISQRKQTLLYAGVAFLTALVILLGSLTWYRQSHTLIIYSLRDGQTVPRMLQIEGKARNTDPIWIVVHPVEDSLGYYVQELIPVDKNNHWVGQILVGPPGEPQKEQRFEIRAFVNPKGAYNKFLEDGTNIFTKWPDAADYASEPVIVLRKPSE